VILALDRLNKAKFGALAFDLVDRGRGVPGQ